MAANGESCERTADGQFTARGLRPGTYLLEATPSLDGPDDRGLGYERGFAVVTIKDADVSGVVIATAPGVTVRGRVRFDESRPGSSPPTLIVVQAALAVTEWQGPSESANVSEDGTFELHDVARTAGLQVRLAVSRPAKLLGSGANPSRRPGHHECSRRLFAGARRRSCGRLPATSVGDCRPRRGRRGPADLQLRGDAAGRSRPAARLVHRGRAPRKPERRGRFYFTNMPPGDYFLAALDGDGCPTPNVLIGNAREIARRATRATVTEGATIHVVVTTSTAAPQP